MVYGGQWNLIPGGAHFQKFKKGTIIFNHKQTEELLKNGQVVSGGGHGKVYVNGSANAYDSGSSGTRRPNSGSYTSITNGGGQKSSGKSSGSSGSESSSSSKSSSSSAKEFEEKFDWIEVMLKRIVEAIDRVKVVAESAYKVLSKRNKAITEEISLIGQQIDIQQKAYDAYLEAAAAVGLSDSYVSKIQSGELSLETITDEDLANKVKEYQDLYDKAIEAKDAIAELHEEIVSLYIDQFNNISDDYENQLSLIEHITNAYEEGMSQLEEKGIIGATAYYRYLSDNEKQNISIMERELSDLEKSFETAMSSGEIEAYSDAWYEMVGSINDVRESIDEATTSLLKYQKSMRELQWEYFDFNEERISDLVKENDFLIELLGYGKQFTDKGQMTNNGTSIMGLHGENYNVYMSQAEDYANAILELNEAIANDAQNTDLINRRQELLDLQQQSIISAENEKRAIVGLVSEGYNMQLSSLKDIISAYNDSLSDAKSLYDYQKKVKDQTKEIATLQKQLSAYSGDNSEENRSRIQKLQVSLEGAMEDLQETQYDRYISDQKKLLDDLYDEYERIINDRLDDVDALISDCIDEINARSADICETLVSESEKVGYTLSDANKAVWENGGSAYDVITKYCDGFQGQLTSINISINGIKAYTDMLLAKANEEAEAKRAAEEAARKKTIEASKPKETEQQKQSTQQNNSSGNNNKFNEDVKKGVAAAIWIYGSKSGWGDDPTRSKLLKEKFGEANAKAIQSYINAHGSNGDLYKYWTQNGKKSLSNYYYSAFAKGARRIGRRQLGWTQDAGSEIILKPSANAILTDLSPGDAVLTSGMTKNLWGFAKNPYEFINNAAGVHKALTRGTSSYGATFGDIVIGIDHVEDYNDLVTKMRNDGTFEKMIQSMTVDRLSGGSKLGKYKYNFK